MNTNNERSVISSWVELYSDSLFSWAFHKTLHKETAEDLVQECFISALNSFATYENKSNPKTWLFSILNHKISDHFRRIVRRPIIHHNAFNESFFDHQENWKFDRKPQPWSDDSVSLLDDPEFIQIWESCLKRLPENWLAVIQLKYLNQENSSSICQELDISKTNYWQMIHRAKLQLRTCLEKNWINLK